MPNTRMAHLSPLKLLKMAQNIIVSDKKLLIEHGSVTLTAERYIKNGIIIKIDNDYDEGFFGLTEESAHILSLFLKQK